MQHAIHLRLLQRMLFRLEPGSWLQHRKGLCRDAVCPIMGTNLIQRRRPNAVPHVRHTAGPEIIFLIAALHQLQHINLVGCAGKIGEKRRFIGHLPLESTRSSHPRLDDPPAQSATLSYRYEAGRH